MKALGPTKKVLLLALATAFIATAGGGNPEPPAKQPAAKPVVPPRIPKTAVDLALADPLNSPTMLYLWCHGATEAELNEQYYTACLVCNTALLQGRTPYKPNRICGGALVRIDLAQLCDSTEQLERLLYLVRHVAVIDEPFFTRTIRYRFENDVWMNLIQVGAGVGGKLTAMRMSKIHHANDPIVQVSPNVDAAIDLGKVFRIDHFAWKALAQVDDGLWYKFRGLEVGKTTLKDYLRSRGFNYERALKNNSIDQAITVSDVTSEDRIIQAGRSEDGRPTQTSGEVWITKDLKRGRNDPNKNGFQSLLNDDEKYFYEVLVQNSAGQLEGTLWDENQILLQAADPEVAADHKIPDKFHKTLHGMITCIDCHGPVSGLKPFVTRFSAQAPGSTRIVADISKPDTFATLSAIATRYHATQDQIDKALEIGRNSLDAQYDFMRLKNGEHGFQLACQSTTAVVDRYKNSFVTAEQFAADLGFSAANGKSIMDAFREAMPYTPGVATGASAIINQVRDGRYITRADADFAYIEAEAIALPAILGKEKP